MSPKTTFRLLLTVSLVSAIGGGIAGEYPGDISEDWKTVKLWNGNDAFYDRVDESAAFAGLDVNIWLIALLSLYVLLAVIVLIGLFRFKRFARSANLWLTGIYLLGTPWLGLVVFMPLESGLMELSTLCAGAVIAMSYLSPVKELFDQGKPAKAAHPADAPPLSPP